MKDLLNIEEVAEIAQVSKSSIYWRIKNKNFPKPIKIKRTKGRGRNILNRWERDQVIKWLMEGNDPQWITQPVEDIHETIQRVDAARQVQNFEPEEPVHEPRDSYSQHMFMALVGGMLAAVIYFLFNT